MKPDVKKIDLRLRLIEDESKSKKSGSILRKLREQKNLSRSDMAKLTRMSPYQVEGLEGKKLQNLLARLSLYARALGVSAGETMRLMGIDDDHHVIQSGSFSVPVAEIKFDQGIILSHFIQQEKHALSMLQLDGGKSLSKSQLPTAEITLCIVREGAFVVDSFAGSACFKKGQFFLLSGNMPYKIMNGCSITRAHSLIISILPSK